MKQRSFGSCALLLTAGLVSACTLTTAAEQPKPAATTPGSDVRPLDSHWVSTANAFTATGLAPQPQHLAISVRDLDASQRWYESKLGFREIVRFTVGPEIRAVTLGLGNFMFELFEAKGSKSASIPADPAAALQTQGITHFGFLVGDVRATYEALAAKGVEFVVTPHEYQKGLPVAFFRDLDGNLFEISPAHPDPTPDK